MIESKKAMHMDKKWKALEARGYKRPKNAEENARRLREAHHGKAGDGPTR